MAQTKTGTKMLRFAFIYSDYQARIGDVNVAVDEGGIPFAYTQVIDCSDGVYPVGTWETGYHPTLSQRYNDAVRALSKSGDVSLMHRGSVIRQVKAGSQLVHTHQHEEWGYDPLDLVRTPDTKLNGEEWMNFMRRKMDAERAAAPGTQP